MKLAKRYVIKGRVQGVGFRYFVIQQARSLALSGTVRNLADGSVEAVAEGPAASLAAFRAQLEKGPSMSRVTEVLETEMGGSGRYHGFDIVY